MSEVVASLPAALCGRRVLVVGGEGFIGRNLIRRLLAEGAEVTSLVRAQRLPRPRGLRELIVGDMRRPAVARRAVAGCEVVFDLAGVASALGSNRDPAASLREDALPHLALLGACCGQPRPPLVVFPSSRLVYGRPARLPVEEDDPKEPTTVYGIHKLAVEQYLRVFGASAGLPWLAFRISNPYGPLQVPGRAHGILNIFAQRAVAGQPIRLFGDGSQRRDFIFIDDLVEVLLRAVATPACHNQVFNLGGAAAVTLREAAELVAEAAGGTPILFEPWPEEHRRIETGDYVGSLRRLAAHLPLPDFVPLRAGIAATVAAYRREAAAGMPAAAGAAHPARRRGQGLAEARA